MEKREGFQDKRNLISDRLKTRIDWIRDMPAYKNGSLVGLRQQIIDSDQQTVNETLDQHMIIIGELVAANIDRFRNHHNSSPENFSKTDQEIKRSLYMEPDEPVVEKLLKLTFWANKMAKTYSEAVKESQGENYQSEYFKKCEEWSYETKDELLSALAFVLISDNYQEVKSWGFKKDKNKYILCVDYPGYNNSFSFHLNIEDILPKTTVEDINNGVFNYPFNTKYTPNSISFKLNEGEIGLLSRLYNSSDFSDKKTSEQHRIIVGLGKIDKLPEIHQSAQPFIKSDSVLNKDFIPAKYELIRDKMVELILQNQNRIYIQRGRNLNRNAAEYGFKQWWNKNYSEFGELVFIETNSGEIIRDAVNLNNGQRNDESDTALIIGSEMGKIMGSKSTIQTLSKLGIYFPRQIIEYTNNPKTADLSINPDYGYSYINNSSYLSVEKLFEFAELGLVDKKLTSEDIEYFGLKDAVESQKQVYDTALKKVLNDYFFNCPDDEGNPAKVAIVPEIIPGGSNIAFRNKECTYYVSFVVKDNGFTFACITNRFLDLIPMIPFSAIQKIKTWKESIKSKGKADKIHIGDDLRIITAGGWKDNFLIEFSDIFENFDSKKYSSEELTSKLTEEFKKMFNTY